MAQPTWDETLPIAEPTDAAIPVAGAPTWDDTFDPEEKYGSPLQTAGAALEGLARGATFGLSTGLESAVGNTLNIEQLKPEAIRAREEQNPIASIGGEIASFAIPGLPVAKAIDKAGQFVAKGLKLGSEVINPTTGKLVYEAIKSPVAQVGSPAVRLAIESALAQSGNEVHKMFAGAPDQTVQTAIADIGLSTLLGGGTGAAFGAISPLWKATVGDKLDGLLSKIQRRANGEPISLDRNVQEALDLTALEVTPEIRAGLSKDPELAKQFNVLRESKTAPGLKLKEGVEKFQEDAKDSVLKALGRTKDDLGELSSVSHYDTGVKLQEKLVDDIERRFKPISEEYDAITDKFSKVAIKQEQDVIADRLAQIAHDERWTLSPSSPQFKLYNETMNELSNVKDLEDLRKFQSIIWGKAKSDPGALWDVSKKINNVLNNTLEESYQTYARQRGDAFLTRYLSAKEAYRTERELIDTLNDRLRVGKYGGPGTFVNALKDMKPEEILNRLSKPNDAGLIQLLQSQFPGLTDSIKKYHLDKELKKAIVATGDGYSIRADTLFKNIDKMTPELRGFILPPGAEEHVQGIRTLLKSLPEYKTSGTAGHLDSLLSKAPGAATALASLLIGQNPAIGYLLGQTAKWVARDAPDAIRLGMLKFLGSGGKVEPEAFKSMVEFINHTIKGESKLSKATKGIFKAGAEVLPIRLMPNDRDREKLNKRLQAYQVDPSGLFNVGGNTGYYLPEQSAAIGKTAMNAVNYLNSLRPNVNKKSPLDTGIKPSKDQLAKFNIALDIAQQPLMVLDSIKKGTITPHEVAVFKTLYPDLYNRTSQKLLDGVIHATDQGESVPYRTRMALSLFLGQPLDSTMTGTSIIAAQASLQGPEGAQPMSAPQPKGTSLKDADKLVQGVSTSSQTREKARATGT